MLGRALPAALLPLALLPLLHAGADAAACTTEQDTDYNGNDLRRVDAVQSDSACCAACQGEPACKFWTWLSANNHCYLKTSDAGRRVIKGRVSGSAAHPATPAPPPAPAPPAPAPDGKEYLTITSGTCGGLGSCAAAATAGDCSAYGARVAGVVNASSVRAALNPAPLGCYLFKETGQLWFNDGSKDAQACSPDRRCLCACAPAIDVAMFHDKGASARGKANIFEVLDYDAGIRVHNFSGDEVRRFLSKDNYDVVLFPGGGGGTEGTTIAAAGQQAVKDFLASGGGYVGICAGAYLALDALKIAPFKNLKKYYGDRGDGNCSLTLSGGSGLAPYVANATLAAQPVFYGGGPVMIPGSAHPDVTDPRVHAVFTAPVPWRADKPTGGRPPYPANASDHDMGVGSAAVVSATYAGRGTVVVVGPHPETDQMDFPHRHGPPAPKGGVRAALLQSFARYAAAPQPPAA